MNDKPKVQVIPEDLEYAAKKGRYCMPGLIVSYGNMKNEVNNVFKVNNHVSAAASMLAAYAKGILHECHDNHIEVSNGLSKAAASYKNTDEDGRQKVDASWRND